MVREASTTCAANIGCHGSCKLGIVGTGCSTIRVATWALQPGGAGCIAISGQLQLHLQPAVQLNSAARPQRHHHRPNNKGLALPPRLRRAS